MEFSRQERWSGLPFPPPGDASNQGIEPMSPVAPELAGGFFNTEPPGKSLKIVLIFFFFQFLYRSPEIQAGEAGSQHAFSECTVSG